jgi:hypothetical protein
MAYVLITCTERTETQSLADAVYTEVERHFTFKCGAVMIICGAIFHSGSSKI